MQHTETYNLNLIETSDTFSPDPLNQNAQALEDALAGESAARASADAALDQRLVKLEAKHVVAGAYTGNGDSSATQLIRLGFTPKVVLIHTRNPGGGFMATSAYYCYQSNLNSRVVEIVDGGFQVRNSNAYANQQNTVYLYIAFD